MFFFRPHVMDACVTREDQIGVLGDILKDKAPSTVLKRVRAISILQDFLKDRESTFPCIV